MLSLRDRKKAGEIVEIVQNQKDGRQIAPSRSPLKDLSVYGEVGDLAAVSDGYGKSDAHLPRFFSVSLSPISKCVSHHPCAYVSLRETSPSLPGPGKKFALDKCHKFAYEKTSFDYEFSLQPRDGCLQSFESNEVL